MKKLILLSAVLLGAASAHAGFGFTIHIGDGPGFRPPFLPAPPVVACRPAPVYVPAPPPYCAPQAPVYEPVAVYCPPVIYSDRVYFERQAEWYRYHYASDRFEYSPYAREFYRRHGGYPNYSNYQSRQNYDGYRRY